MWPKVAILVSMIAMTSIAFTTFNDGLAVIVDHYEGGQREIYDTDDPGARGCESPHLICNLSVSVNNAANNTSASFMTNNVSTINETQSSGTTDDFLERKPAA